MNTRILLVPALALTLVSCSTLKKGYDSVATGTKAAWGAVAGAGESVVEGTTNLGKKTASAVTGNLKDEPGFAELMLSYNGKVGSIIIQLDETAAPEHVKNFRKLAKQGFYDNMGVHRTVPDTLIQTGDPRSRHESSRSVWGLGGPGYTLPAEINLPHKRGSVGMARLGNRLNPTRQSNGSQFYICLKPMPALNGEYTVFGQVTSGLKFADAVSKADADQNDAPVRMVKVLSLRLIDDATAAAAPEPAPEVLKELEASAAPEFDMPLEDDAPRKSRRSQEPQERKGWFGRVLGGLW